tara:strand:+ start:347 stop:556 length:210 start_codon:yes stop_codon:yes gene_type:complete
MLRADNISFESRPDKNNEKNSLNVKDIKYPNKGKTMLYAIRFAKLIEMFKEFQSNLSSAVTPKYVVVKK